MAQEFTIKTWACACGYRQDFVGVDCLSCGLKNGLKVEVDNTKKIKVRVLEPADVDALEVSDEKKIELKAQLPKALADMKKLEHK